MSRYAEILLYLTPVLAVAVWRLLFPAPLPPLWLVRGVSAFAALMLLALIWSWHLDARDAHRAYVPARLDDGQVVPARQGPPQ